MEPWLPMSPRQNKLVPPQDAIVRRYGDLALAIAPPGRNGRAWLHGEKGHSHLDQLGHLGTMAA